MVPGGSFFSMVGWGERHGRDGGTSGGILPGEGKDGRVQRSETRSMYIGTLFIPNQLGEVINQRCKNTNGNTQASRVG